MRLLPWYASSQSRSKIRSSPPGPHPACVGFVRRAPPPTQPFVSWQLIEDFSPALMAGGSSVSFCLEVWTMIQEADHSPREALVRRVGLPLFPV